MIDVRTMVTTKEAEDGFYPTPPRLIDKMMALVDWRCVESILEPSAGKGDLALAAAKRLFAQRGHYGALDLAKVDLDCVEIDGNLRAILREKGLRVVHDDFLTYDTQKRYSLIVMNPPFSEGARHMLRAHAMLAPGGQMVCLLNAETVKNPYSQERAALSKVMEEMGAAVEFVPDAFVDAERKTGVEVALISYKKPAAAKEESLIMDRLRPAHKYVDMTEQEEMALTKADYVEAIVDRYRYEVECGCALIREWRAMNKLLSSDMSADRAYSLNIMLTVGQNKPDENNYVESVRKKYWSALFCAPQFTAQLTGNLLSDLHRRVDELSNYEFSVYNIREIMQQMSQHVNSGVEGTIMELFDDWTRKYHWDENAQNRHYFDGWRTNDAFAVNKRVIIPLRAYTDWGRYGQEFRAYNVREKLEDIEKVFNYLDGGRTACENRIADILAEVEKTGKASKVDSKYFLLTFYKKGTCHLEFKNLDLLAKFNIFAARGKNWLPPSFGRKKYAEMDHEEQRVVKSFMGSEKKYDAVVAHADYFLATGSEMLRLGA